MRRPLSRGVEPLATATLTSATGAPAASQSSQARARTGSCRLPRRRTRDTRACSASSVISTARAWPAGRAAGTNCSRRRSAIASEMRVQDRERQHQRRLADGLAAVDRGLAVRCAFEQAHVEDARPVASRPGSCRSMGACVRSRPLLVPPQFLGREPAHALDEAAFDLARCRSPGSATCPTSCRMSTRSTRYSPVSVSIADLGCSAAP